MINHFISLLACFVEMVLSANVKHLLSILLAGVTVLSFCIALSSAGNSYTQITQTPWVISKLNGVTTYYALESTAYSYVNNGQTMDGTNSWSSTDCTTATDSTTCFNCKYASKAALGLVATCFVLSTIVFLINIYHYAVQKPDLTSFIGFLSGVVWILAILAFGIYDGNCFTELRNNTPGADDDINHNLMHGAGFNGCVAGFFFMFVHFVLNFVPTKTEVPPPPANKQ